MSVPIRILTRSGRYATALFRVAKNQNKLVEVENDLKKVKSQLLPDPIFMAFAKNPLLTIIKKGDIMEKYAIKNNLNKESKNLLVTLAENGRLEMLSKVLNDFDNLMAHERNEVKCVITSAEDLSGAVKTDLQDALTKMTSKGKKLLFEFKTDSEIIGGLKIMLGDNFLDLSMKTRLDNLKKVVAN